MKNVVAAALVATLATFAQTSIVSGQSSEDLLKLKQNPVGGLRSISVQSVINPDTPIPGKTQSSNSLQVVWPFAINDDWRLITYTIAPVIHQPFRPQDGGSVTGLGDTLVNLYITPKNPGTIVWGIGPAVLLPSRTDPALGTNRWGFGPSGILFYAKNNWSAGVVLQNVQTFGGEDPNRVNTFAAQYIINYNLSDGWFLLSNSTITSNWLATSDDRWTVPIGGGFGKLFNIGKQPVSATAQAFYNVVTPTNGPKWTVILQFSLLFP